jgi:hypothetical protein
MTVKQGIKVSSSEYEQKRQRLPNDTKAMLLAMEDSGLIDEDTNEEDSSTMMTIYF